MKSVRYLSMHVCKYIRTYVRTYVRTCCVRVRIYVQIRICISIDTSESIESKRLFKRVILKSSRVLLGPQSMRHDSSFKAIVFREVRIHRNFHQQSSYLPTHPIHLTLFFIPLHLSGPFVPSLSQLRPIYLSLSYYFYLFPVTDAFQSCATEFINHVRDSTQRTRYSL